MSDSKKFNVDISKSLLRNISSNLTSDYEKKEEAIDDSIILYIEDDFSIEFIESMKNGYIEMADINLEMSELGLEQDVCDFIEYESRL
ncbi:CopG family transcriptional regulator [Clostridium senegalense]|uniref:CopG family transcriptional regulator n=1 Tax=Clostridium senegalense TaxID=1465809 RepID=UPI001C12713F|nr:CopG family transcriptional regulator [Clostridium senegalense]MBU5226445.1 CopG family transcriptional regulator [Clostridium senegalense]